MTQADVAAGTRLTAEETAMLAGEEGPAVSLAMRVLMIAARAQKAERLIPISAAHIDGCLYHGPSSLDFVRVLVEGGGQVRVPTTLNVGGLDLSRPDLFLGPVDTRTGAAELMESYVQLGCRPTFTCAPYQLPGRPETGADFAWAESNAIVFGNSMIGLRTNRYGDLIDMCAAIAGRVPYSGLHIPANRAARAVFTVEPDVMSLDEDLLPALLGHHVSRLTGTMIPAIDAQDHGKRRSLTRVLQATREPPWQQTVIPWQIPSHPVQRAHRHRRPIGRPGRPAHFPAPEVISAADPVLLSS